VGSDFEKQLLRQTPLGRIGQPNDIAPVAVFLASNDARWVTGRYLQYRGACESELLPSARHNVGYRSPASWKVIRVTDPHEQCGASGPVAMRSRRMSVTGRLP
jgi:hypothetical protein